MDDTLDATLDVTFYGVRGSTPCPSDVNARYGGNTSCVVVDVPGGDPILLDLGTGLRFYGVDEPCDQAPFRGTALVSHLHWRPDVNNRCRRGCLTRRTPP